MARLNAWCAAVAAALCVAAAAPAQTHPLAALSGRVTGPDGAPLAGVLVVASSPALQGVRDTTTTEAGDYRIPFLPPGDYQIGFRRDGYQELRAHRTLRAAETARLDAELELAAVAETITVDAEPASLAGRSFALATSHTADLLDRVPGERDPRAAALLAPGVAASGSDGVTIAGAMPYENLWLVDGVAVKDRVFGQPRPFAIEDAIDQTSTAVAGISAEYGRFSGGVVNVVTRAGGNRLAGSLRATLANDAWRSLTPHEREALAADPRDDAVVPTWETALGGPLVRDRLWYFLAARREEIARAETLAYTDLPYRYGAEETRLDGKLTWTPRAGRSLRAGWREIDTRERNRAEGVVMDHASLGSVTTPEDLLSLHATSALAGNLFVEGQVSRRRRTLIGLGSHTTDRIGGTLLQDGSRGAFWGSPRFCGVCGERPGELRRTAEEDRAAVAKVAGFFSGPRAGAHDVVVGGEVFEERRRSNSYQTGSGFLVVASGALLVDGAIHPVFRPDGSTFLEWTPMLNLSRGSRFRTTSLFVNDRWRLGRRWSFNLGLRWDADDSRDQARARAGESDAWSPRLAAAFDPRGDGAWSLDAGYARYVASLAFGVGDLGTTHGRPARFAFNYLGPPVNDGSSGLVTTEEALAILFAWFDANGGTSRPLRGVPTFPGLNRRMDPDLVLPKVDETTLGVTRRLGGRGLLRVAALRRDYVDQHSIRVDLGTGQVADPGSGRRFDLRLIGNSDRVERTYEALLAQLDFRPRAALRLAGSYTLSATRGNLDLGDSSTIDDDLRSFPEYGEERWRAPTGPLAGDQRHRLRLWASWDATLPAGRGRLSIAALERVESGQAWSAVGEIDSRPYVANPGYVGPPARVPYYFERRGRRRTETATATDLAVHATFSAPALRRVEPFARLVVVNLFDESAQTGPGRTTVLTAANDPRYRPFDPFRETPVRGVHWDYAPGFGRALDASDYQQPRTVEVAVGLRF